MGPRPSIVVNFTPTLSGGRESTPAIRRRIASRCGASRGFSARTVASTLTIS